MKLVDGIVKWVGFAGAVVGIFWFAIANPDIVNAQLYDAVNRALPFLMLAFGFMAGWSVRDSAKRRDAETAARIERENAEHAERMRREREKREAEQKARREAEDAERRRAQRRGALAAQFREERPATKAVVARMHREGRVEMTEDEFRMLGLGEWASYDTVSEDWLGHGVTVSAKLDDSTESMLRERPELLEHGCG